MRSLLLPSFNKAFRRGSHTTTFVDVRLSRSYNQAAQVPSSKVTCNISAQPVDKLQNHARFGLDDAFHHDLAVSIS